MTALLDYTKSQSTLNGQLVDVYHEAEWIHQVREPHSKRKIPFDESDIAELLKNMNR